MTSPSPSPSPSRLPLALPEAEKKKRTVYMFFQHRGGEINHSLFKVEIPNQIDPLMTSVEKKPSRSLLPTLSFRTTDFPLRMSCVVLGSKFYFLGGQMAFDTYCPPNVYIFDPATATAITTTNTNALDHLTQGPPMKTGKPFSVLLFVAYGNLYALSSPEKYLSDCYLEYFEVFDPKTNNWSTLPTPPFMDYSMQAHAIVKSKVYILAGPLFHFGDYRLFCFHLDNNEWAPSKPLAISSDLNARRIYVTHLMPDIVQGALYAFGYLQHSLVALSPAKDSDEISDGDAEYFKRLIHILPEEEDMFPQSGQLMHLGNRCFCYVVGCNPSKFPRPKDPDDLACDTQTIYIGLRIFEALSNTFVDKDGGTCSKAKLLHSAHFIARFKWDTDIANLFHCLLIPIVGNDAGYNGEAEL